jgi:hypothetical protein
MTRLSSNLPSYVPMQRYPHGGNNRALAYGEFHLFVGNNRDRVNAAAAAWQNNLSGDTWKRSVLGDSVTIDGITYQHYSLELSERTILVAPRGLAGHGPDESVLAAHTSSSDIFDKLTFVV